MQELLALYTELVSAANADQIPLHLENMLKDAAVIAEAVRGVIETAKARANQPA